MRDRADDLQLDGLLGQQAQRPARLALRRRTAGQCDQPRLLRTIEGPLVAARARLGQQRGRQALLDKALTHALDSAGAQAQRTRGLLIGSAGPGLGLVHLQEHARVGQLAGISSALADQRGEFLAFGGRQRHTVFLGHTARPGPTVGPDPSLTQPDSSVLTDY